MLNKSAKYLLVLPVLLVASPALAVCPICTVAVVAGLGLSRYLGIDDTVSGLWIGALILATVLWTIIWFNKKGWRFVGRDVLILLTWYSLVVGPLFYYEIIGHPLNKIWGIDKLILGILVGSLSFAATEWLDQFMRKQHPENKAHFKLQKVILPICGLLIFSLIFYLITR
ncbi:MAG: hypothetical protein WCW02_02950 [Candidatus Buchananbacteria bacterium]